MINKIDVENFKCFHKFSLPMRNVNILSGINGMGKSTMIQSLLLLRQSMNNNDEIKGLRINGEYVSLGNGQDILYEKAEEEQISLGYEEDGISYFWKFEYSAESDFLPVIEKKEGKVESTLFSSDFSYLSAYRIEPKELYGVKNEIEIDKREFGNNGEFALQYLGLHGDDKVVNDNIIIEDKLDNSLANQVRVWMDKISPGVSPKITVNMSLRKSEVRYEFIEGREKSGSYKSVNVGFGITYVLPLVIALISAKKGDIIVIENPEAHIHPAGQSMLGELIARAGSGGVQIIVETHSDHILNGLRLAVKKKMVDKDEIVLSFFYRNEKKEFKHECIHPKILEDGRLDCWPEGFFDEWDKALYDLI
ncbi:Uncharacterized conserved protein [uncultured Eubacterium sp.]|nr:DUF3696 domain-containing protein [uncultured Anaerostipes sp.]SCJ31513.1 Uncharacterized conserved protein [uncultured Eubacterium sp.]